MKNILLLIICLPIFIASCQKEDQIPKNDFVPLSKELRPLIHDIGSKWVYQDRYGNKDSAIIIGIDSSIVKKQNASGNFLDLQVVEINYSPNKALGEKQIFESNYIYQESKKWSPALANLLYFSKRNMKSGEEHCIEDDCLRWVETLDVLLVNGIQYFDVSHLKTSDHEFWWDPSIGIVKFKSEKESWELLRTDLKS